MVFHIGKHLAAMQKDLFEIVFTCFTNGNAGTRG